MDNNYFFIDGSALLSHIRQLQKQEKDFCSRKLDPIKLIKYYFNTLGDLIDDSYKRAVFYFPVGETQDKEYLLMPDLSISGKVRDINFKYCGRKLKNSDAYTRFLDTVPKRWIDHVSKSEKGVDIEICCDALKLASAGRIDRLFIMTNDSDFAPLFRTLKDFGVNVSLIHITSIINVNKKLLCECDSYDSIPLDRLNNLFFPPFVRDEKGLPANSEATIPPPLSE